MLPLAVASAVIWVFDVFGLLDPYRHSDLELKESSNLELRETAKTSNRCLFNTDNSHQNVRHDSHLSVIRQN
jgi:hypothetical protein